MNSPLEISQLLLLRTAQGPNIVARSDEVTFAMEEFANRTAVSYGELPDGVEAVFALPADAAVSVVTVRKAVFRSLFLNSKLYRWIGDPFEIADHFPVNVESRGRLPSLEWPNDEPRPIRKVQQVQRILKDGDSALLLGSAQALLDGTRIRIVRPEPDRMLRSLWRLLPDACRSEVWPAEYSPNNQLPFHIAMVPGIDTLPPGSIDGERAKDYPEGRYELALQVAAGSGDQAALDRLFARRSPRDVLRMALTMLAFAIIVVVFMKLI